MYQQITKCNFRDAFERYGRASAWTYEGLGLLYDYLTELEGATGQMELDVVEIDCTYSEYSEREIEADNEDLWGYVVAQDVDNDVYIVEG